MDEDSLFTPPTAEHLAWVEKVRADYRAMWAKLRNVPVRAFVGDHTDVLALDFIDYEAGSHPHDLAGAAIIWGGALAATGVVRWAVGFQGQLVLTNVDVFPRVCIDPTARTIELEHTSVPQPGEKYHWLVEESVSRLIGLGFDEAQEAALAALISAEPSSFFEYMTQQIARLAPPKSRR